MKKKAPTASTKQPKPWLETASRARLLSLLFQLPTRESRRELRRLAATAPKDLSALAKEWTSIPVRDAAAEFHRVLGPGGIPAVESSYDPNALAGRGPLLADIAGFHEAFAYRPENPPAAVPDHIAVELDFLSYLAFKIAFALHEARQDEAEIAVKAYGRFLEAHLSLWVARFQKQLEHSASLFFIRAAQSIQLPEMR